MVVILLILPQLAGAKSLPRTRPTDVARSASFEPIPPASPNGPPSPAVGGCPDGNRNPLAYVWHPDRLLLQNPCEEVRGRVIAVKRQGDGDYHVWLAPDKGYEFLVNAANVYNGQPGLLVLEIIPNCSSEPEDAHAASLCPSSPIPPPRVGQHIRALGAWVLDTAHDWLEIHPVDVLTAI